MKPSESRRATRTKDAGAMKKVYYQLMGADKAMEIEDEAVVRVVGTETMDTGATMAHYSME